MIGKEQLKPFILDANECVRTDVMRYFAERWIYDPEIVPLVLEACDKYGIIENRLLLVYAKRQPISSAVLDKILDRLDQTDDANVIYYLNGLPPWAPLDVIEARFDELNKRSRKLVQHTGELINHRPKFAEMSAEKLNTVSAMWDNIPIQVNIPLKPVRLPMPFCHGNPLHSEASS